MTPRKFDRYMVALGLGTHPKMARLTDSEFRAHVVGVLALAAMSPVRGCLLVGDLPAEPVDVAAAAGVPARVAASAMRKLEMVGVLLRDDEHDCLRVHDWDDVNPPPKADTSNAERQARHRARNAARNGASNAPVTVRVTPPEVEVEVEVEKHPVAAAPPAESDPVVERLCSLMSQHVRSAHDIAPTSREARVTKGWRAACRALLTVDGYTERQVEYAIGWVCRHHYWSRRIKSMTRLRSEMAEVAKQIAAERGGAQVVPIRRESAGDLIRAINEDGGAA